MDTRVVQTTIRLDEDLPRRVQITKIERGCTVTEAIHRGLRWWLDDNSTAPSLLDGLTKGECAVIEKHIALLRSKRAPKHTRAIALMIAAAEGE